jgi:hypothetical protein
MRRALFLLLLGPALAVPPPAPDPLDVLVSDSPFVPAGASSGRRDAPTSSGPLELRGIVFQNGGYSFGIYDQGTHEATWVRLGEKGQPFVARSYNRERDTLTVEFQGRTMILSLPAAKMVTANQAPPGPSAPPPLPDARAAKDQRAGAPPAEARPAGTQNPAAGSPAAVTNPTEAQRLQNLADELRRRRGSGPQPVEPPKN